MGQWLEKKSNWLKNNNNHSGNNGFESSQEKKEDKSRAYGVEFIPLRCPKCRSKSIKCYGSKLPIRYHYCKDCGYNFKSVEKDY